MASLYTYIETKDLNHDNGRKPWTLFDDLALPEQDEPSKSIHYPAGSFEGSLGIHRGRRLPPRSNRAEDTIPPGCSPGRRGRGSGLLRGHCMQAAGPAHLRRSGRPTESVCSGRSSARLVCPAEWSQRTAVAGLLAQHPKVLQITDQQPMYANVRA